MGGEEEFNYLGDLFFAPLGFQNFLQRSNIRRQRTTFIWEHFLAVQNSSIGDLVPWSLGPAPLNNQSLHNNTE